MNREEIYEMLKLLGPCSVLQLMQAFGVHGVKKAWQIKLVLRSLIIDIYVQKIVNGDYEIYRIIERTDGKRP